MTHRANAVIVHVSQQHEIDHALVIISTHEKGHVGAGQERRFNTE
jgi:hypothetical protein